MVIPITTGEVVAPAMLTRCDVEHLINGIYNKTGSRVWDGGWQAGADNILRMFGIRVWDNFGKINKTEVEKIRSLSREQRFCSIKCAGEFKNSP